MMFTEKYRPKTREEIVGNKDTIDNIFKLVNSGNLTHMIFEGQPGVGKTSTALVIARMRYGEWFRSNFVEMNASDNRRLEDVRTKIKPFIKTAPLNADDKILLLDEADYMDHLAQPALRRLMEKYSNITKLIFSVNNLEKLIDAIQSRCETFRFGPISIVDMVPRLYYIYQQERGITPNPEKMGSSFIKIARFANGDMRKAINHLQLLLAQNKALTPESVEVNRPTDFGKLIYDKISIGRLIEARKEMQKALELGYRERYLLDLIHKVYKSETLDFTIKSEAVFVLAETDYRMTLGINKSLAMDNLLFKLVKLHVK